MEGVDRRFGDREERAGHEAKQRRLAARHFRLQKRSDDEVVHFKRAVGDPLAVERREGRAGRVRMSKRLRAIGYSMSAASSMQSLPSSGSPGAKSFETPELFDRVPLAVEDDDRAFAAHGALQILGDEISERGRFARVGAARRSTGAKSARAWVFRRRIRRRENSANGVPARKGEGSSRWCGSSSLGGLACLPRGTPETRYVLSRYRSVKTGRVRLRAG